MTSTTRYTYDTATDQLKTVTKPGGATITYAYDENGATVGRKRTGETTETFEYTPEHQLAKVIKPTGEQVLFTYDGDNTRVSKSVVKVVGGVTTTETTSFVYDEDLLVQETDAGGVTSTYTYDADGAPVKVVRGSSTYYFHFNGQGDVVALTDASGAVVATYAYDPWGTVVSKTGTVDISFGYRGKYGYVFDKETNLYFLKSRYYDPEIGRFTTKDRFEGFEESPATQHPYVYCGNDPVNNIDPEGEIFETLLDIAFIGYDGYQLWKRPSWENAGYFAWSVIAAFIPFVPGSYVVHAGSYGYKAARASGHLRVASKVARKAVVRYARQSNTSRGLGNPFRGATLNKIKNAVIRKGFKWRGNPATGKGNWVNPKTGRSYHLDPGGYWTAMPQKQVCTWVE